MKQTNAKTKKILKRVVSFMLTVLIVVMLLTAGYFMYCNINGKVAFVGGYALVKIITPSMEPTIPTGTYILVEEIEADSVSVGDVILFYSRDAAIYGKINTHRVVEVVSDGGELSFVTRGDKNLVNDQSPVLAQDVIGRYVKNTKVISAIANFISKPYIFLLIVVVPSVLLIMSSIRDFLKTIREERIKKLVEKEVEKLKEKDKDKNCDGKDPTDHV